MKAKKIRTKTPEYNRYRNNIKNPLQKQINNNPNIMYRYNNYNKSNSKNINNETFNLRKNFNIDERMNVYLNTEESNKHMRYNTYTNNNSNNITQNTTIKYNNKQNKENNDNKTNINNIYRNNINEKDSCNKNPFIALLSIVKTYSLNSMGKNEENLTQISQILEQFQLEMLEYVSNNINGNNDYNNDNINVEINEVFESNFAKILKFILNVFGDNEKNWKKCESEIGKLISQLKSSSLLPNQNIQAHTINLPNKINNYNIGSLREIEKRMVNSINNLSSAIKGCMRTYRESICEIGGKIRNIRENDGIIDADIINGINKIDENQNKFYTKAKEIFSELKDNHLQKIEIYNRLFNSSNNQKKRGKSLPNEKIRKNDDEKKEEYKENLYALNGNNNNETSKYILSDGILDFFRKMNELQENIIKKSSNVSKLKVEFERSKKYIQKLAKQMSLEKPTDSMTKLNIIKNEVNFTYLVPSKNMSISFIQKSDNRYKKISMLDIEKKDKELEELRKQIKEIMEKNKEDIIDNNIENKIKIDVESNINEYSNNNKRNNKNNNTSDNKELINDIEIKNKKISSLKSEISSLRSTIKNCISTIYSCIKETNPDMVDEEFFENDNENNIKNNINDDNNINDSKTNNNTFYSNEFISGIVEKFKAYNKEINEELKKLEEEKEKLEKEKHENELKAEAYKNALDQAINKMNSSMEFSEKDKEKSIENIDNCKRQFTFDGEGDISFKSKDKNINIINNNNENINDSNNNINNDNSNSNSDIRKSNNNKKNDIKSKDNASKIDINSLLKDKLFFSDDNDNIDNIINMENMHIDNGDNEGERNDLKISSSPQKSTKNSQNSIENNQGNNIDNNLEKKLIKNSDDNIENNILKSKESANKNSENIRLSELQKQNSYLLDIQKKLLEKIKEQENEINNNKDIIHNYFIEVNDQLYNDNDEATVTLEKYNKLLGLMESEQEKNRLIEKKYLKLLSDYAELASRFNIEKEDNFLISSKKISESFQNEIEKLQTNTNPDDDIINNDNFKNNDKKKYN